MQERIQGPPIKRLERLQGPEKRWRKEIQSPQIKKQERNPGIAN
jgi:hypothetical protein